MGLQAAHEAAIAEACRAAKIAAVVGMPTCVVGRRAHGDAPEEDTAQTTTTWYNSATVYVMVPHYFTTWFRCNTPKSIVSQRLRPKVESLFVCPLWAPFFSLLPASSKLCI